jgi:hypothetical protein
MRRILTLAARSTVEVCVSTEMDPPSASHLGMGDRGFKTDRSRPRSVPVNALLLIEDVAP